MNEEEKKCLFVDGDVEIGIGMGFLIFLGGEGRVQGGLKTAGSSKSTRYFSAIFFLIPEVPNLGR